ncbi:hypothetical protein BGZ68_000635 [Mortierella alpina]|nr:hypothetical protein BGZ68_000635 [Mortierella alpina]
MALLLAEIEGTNLSETWRPIFYASKNLMRQTILATSAPAWCSLDIEAYIRNATRGMHMGSQYFIRDRITLIHSYAVPCPDGTIIDGIDCAGLVVVLDIAEGDEVRRVCVATTHIVCTSLRGFKKLGQIMAVLSAAKVLLRRNLAMPLILTGDMNALAGSLLMEYIVKGSVNLLAMPEEDFARVPLGRPSSTVSERHRDRVKEFKKETWGLRDLVAPGALAYPKAIRTRPRTSGQEDLAAPVATTFAPKVDALRHMIKTHRDLEDDVVAHPLHLSSVYDVPSIPDFIFHGEIMGCSPRLELAARLVLPDLLLQLKSGLPAAHLGSDHLAIGAKYRFRD